MRTNTSIAAAVATTLLVATACSGTGDETSDVAAAESTASASSSSPGPAPPVMTPEPTTTPPASSTTPSTTPSTAPATTPATTASSPTTTSPPETTTEPITLDERTLQAILDRWRADAVLNVLDAPPNLQAFGATVSLRVPGHGDIHLASGIDDRDPDTPMPTDGTYRIDRVTRTFVVAVAFQLIAEGRLSLDDPIDHWLPEVADADSITVEMLLEHTSGLGDWNEDSPTYVDELVSDLARAYTPEEALAKHLEQPRRGEPGERFARSRGDSIALGLVIQRELAQDLATVITERITEPLSLRETVLSDGSVGPTRHGWFSLDPGPPELDANTFPQTAVATSAWAAGGMTSSSADLLDWTEALYSGELLGDDLTTAMVEMRNSVAGEPTIYYGLGATGYCVANPDCASADVELAGHAGNFAGSATRIAYHPESGTSVVVHANVSPMDTKPFVDLLAEILNELGLT